MVRRTRRHADRKGCSESPTNVFSKSKCWNADCNNLSCFLRLVSWVLLPSASVKHMWSLQRCTDWTLQADSVFAMQDTAARRGRGFRALSQRKRFNAPHCVLRNTRQTESKVQATMTYNQVPSIFE